eukprot:CAMPEP_0172646852 /NCGR_PEP_ID=MMETSP1068-20121228/240453_1 /TAXON_ID=35684 /ORGANISM="Pseudopedinella elastica, Strain CCMP716" /LENGTH=117 /DNA_ID=CAMNT_0013461117 /DNA_START=488 /DNA_END=838 /DNA_ORIENTATION=+
MAVSKRLYQAMSSHVSFAPILAEQAAAIHLSDPALFMRTRAELPLTAKSTIALAFSSDRRTLASTHGDHTVKLVDVVAATKQAMEAGQRGGLGEELAGGASQVHGDAASAVAGGRGP